MDADRTAAFAASIDSLAPGPASKRILIVDDDGGIRFAVERGLREAGYRTDCAEDGEAGWDALRTDTFDALITDHEMPRLTGLGLIRRVRAEPLRLPVILMSGRMPSDEAVLFRLLPPGAALKKPFTLSELLAKLRAVLTPAPWSPPGQLGPGA